MYIFFKRNSKILGYGKLMLEHAQCTVCVNNKFHQNRTTETLEFEIPEISFLSIVGISGKLKFIW